MWGTVEVTVNVVLTDVVAVTLCHFAVSKESDPLNGRQFSAGGHQRCSDDDGAGDPCSYCRASWEPFATER